MALNIADANAQIALLKQQSAATAHTARLLSSYWEQLQHAWSGIDGALLRKSVNVQIQSCEVLCRETDLLCQKIAQAVEDIRREEADEGAAASRE